MRELYEGSPDISFAAIGKIVGVSKNVVIGQAHRGSWDRGTRPFIRFGGNRIKTMADRLDELNAKLDRVLAETAPWVEHRKPLMVVAA